MQKESKRNTNIELLRIASMLMIIAHHYIYYGVMQNYDSEIACLSYQQGSVMNKIIAQLLLPGGIVGVGIFFLIMGYFGIQSNNMKMRQIVKDTLFYSILGLFIYIACGICGLFDLYNLKDSILSCVNPVANSTYWFISVYIIISMMKPVLNNAISAIGGGYKTLYFIIILLVYYSFVRYNAAVYLGIINGLVFYIFGALIKKNEEMLCQKKRSQYLFFGLIGWILYVLFNNILWLNVHSLNGLFSIVGICFFGTVSIIGLSLFFLSGKKYINTKINILASTTFSVYLIHEHPLVRRLLWSNIFHVDTLQWHSPCFILLALISIILIFAFSAIFELARKRLFAFIRFSFNKIKHNPSL